MCIGSAHYAGRRLNRDGEEIYPFRILFKHVCLEQRYISVPWECKNPRWWIHPLAPRTYRLEEQFWRTYVAPVPRCSPYHRKLPTIAISAQQLREKPVSEIEIYSRNWEFGCARTATRSRAHISLTHRLFRDSFFLPLVSFASRAFAIQFQRCACIHCTGRLKLDASERWMRLAEFPALPLEHSFLSEWNTLHKKQLFREIMLHWRVKCFTTAVNFSKI